MSIWFSKSWLIKKKKIFAKKLCTPCSRTSYKIVLLKNLNKYLHNDTSEPEVNINININISVNNDSEEF